MKTQTPHSDKTHMSTLVQRLNSLLKEGFEAQFSAKENGLQLMSTEKIYKPDEVKILNFYRFEGDSNPSDNSILYAIETFDGMKGTLVDAYGPYGDSNVSAFISKVEEINKKVNKGESL